MCSKWANLFYLYYRHIIKNGEQIHKYIKTSFQIPDSQYKYEIKKKDTNVSLKNGRDDVMRTMMSLNLIIISKKRTSVVSIGISRIYNLFYFLCTFNSQTSV